MATITVVCNRETFTSKYSTNEDVKGFEDFLYENDINKINIETNYGKVLIKGRAFDNSVFIFEYDEEK